MNIRSLLILLCCFPVLLFPKSVYGQSSKEKQIVRKIQTNIDRAASLFKTKKYDSSKRYVEKALEEFNEIEGKPSAEFLAILQPEYARLAKAHELLTQAGQELSQLKPLAGASATMGGAVSFTKSVAPILVAKCGNCHVSANRGDFNASTFEMLDKSTTIAYGLPDSSRLIEVIESGEMPKGGLKVEPDELKILKSWILQGAKFDGENPRASLTSYVAAPRPNRPRVEVKQATGRETVSFGLDVAPVLLEHCARCHITQNPRGNFSMADFRSFLRGGDGGAPVMPGKSAESEIIKRLRGEEAELMPPDGKLDDKIIEKIAKWIDEGATFDGGDERLAMATVAAKVKAMSQTHEELAADRKELAGRTWELVMDDVKGMAIPSDNFVVTGSTSESRLTDVSQLCETLVPKIAKELRASTKSPLVKGNISVFVFDKRYDFSEFGKMVENRDFPKEMKSHWGYTIIDAYSAVLMTRNQSAEEVQVALTQQIAALHTASLAPDVPRWFADGMGLYTANRVFRGKDEMKSLEDDAAQAMAAMVKIDDFVQNRMPADQAAKVSYLFIKQLKSNSSAFGKLMKGMSGGESFGNAFRDAYGKSPAELISGVQKKSANRRNRR